MYKIPKLSKKNEIIDINVKEFLFIENIKSCFNGYRVLLILNIKN